MPFNASAYLQSQGWKEGEAFKEGGRNRPFLLPKKTDLKGVGTKKYDTNAWWENIFDNAIMNVGEKKTPQQKSIAKQEVVSLRSSNPLNNIFESGGIIDGTLKESNKDESTSGSTPISSAASSEVIESRLEVHPESSSTHSTRKSRKRLPSECSAKEHHHKEKRPRRKDRQSIDISNFSKTLIGDTRQKRKKHKKKL